MSRDGTATALAATSLASPLRPVVRLPPLNALRVLVVAARHLSFTRAAEELFVTPAAVGQQVRLLEEHLGCALFRRNRGQLLLTDEAQACVPGLTEGFEMLARALREIDAVRDGPVLSVSVAPSFAQKWLLPRIDAFQLAHPDLDVRISAAMQLVDFDAEDVDCAIRFGPGHYPGLLTRRLLSESVVPVAAPELIARLGMPATPRDLDGWTLLHDDSPDRDAGVPDWPMWLRAAGVADGIDALRGPRFDQSSLVIESALLGRGVALAKARLAEGDLAAGRLVRLFDLRHPIEFAYWLVYPERKGALRRVRAFEDWLFEEARREMPEPEYVI